MAHWRMGEPRAGGRDAYVGSHTLKPCGAGARVCYEPPPMPVLTAREVTKAYGLRPLFENATFTIRRGEKVALLGPNGTGKSTLLARPRRPRAARYGEHRPPARRHDPLPPAGARARPRRVARARSRARASRSGTRRSRATTRSRTRIGEGETTTRCMAEQASLAEDVERLGGWSRDHEVDEILAPPRRRATSSARSAR